MAVLRRRSARCRLDTARPDHYLRAEWNGSHLARTDRLCSFPHLARRMSMRMRVRSVASAALVFTCALAGTAHAAPKQLEPLNQYVVKGGDQSKLSGYGFDLTEGGGPNGHAIVGTPAQAAELRAKGSTVTAPYGEAKRASAAPPDPFATQPTHGYDVFRPWHLTPAPCPGTCAGAVDSAGKPINLQTWYENQRAAHPDIVKKVVYGH